MTLRLGDVAPDFQATTTQGDISFHDWIGDSWALLFSHPKDFTPVCTTELGAVQNLAETFASRDCKVIGVSVDTIEQHSGWVDDIESVCGAPVTFPLVADPDLSVATAFGMLPAGTQGDAARTAADNFTARTVFLIGPDKTIKMMMTYPMSTGRNFDEILRVLDSIQLTASHQVATPANWVGDDDVIVAPSVSDDEARQRHGEFVAPLPYLRYVKAPG